MKTLALNFGTAAGLALDLETVKSDLRISGDALDEVLTAQYIPAAIAWAEGETGRALVSKTLVWVVDRFPQLGRYAMHLPGGKVTAVANIRYVSNETVVTLTGSSASPAGNDFQEHLDDHGSYLMPLQGETWPDVDSDAIRPVQVTYTAGWATEADVPADLKRALTAYIYGAMELDGLLQIRQGFDIDHASKLISAYRAPHA